MLYNYGMPSRNRVKIYVPESCYHVYNRGINRQTIFKDDQDYSVFLNLLKRYLDNEEYRNKIGVLYDKLNNKIELLAFCLLKNHYHLLIYQKESDSITKLLRRVPTAYTLYFNRKYRRSGPLFTDRFKASRISSDEYLQHISRYIHLNPKDYTMWEFSSLPYYLGKKNADWVCPSKILDLFARGEYIKFVEDYEAYKKTLDEIKDELANSGEF